MRFCGLAPKRSQQDSISNSGINIMTWNTVAVAADWSSKKLFCFPLYQCVGDLFNLFITVDTWEVFVNSLGSDQLSDHELNMKQFKINGFVKSVNFSNKKEQFLRQLIKNQEDGISNYFI